jgi:hypothetical protein
VWAGHVTREIARYEDGEARLPSIEDRDERQRQLTRMGNAAGGAGLSLLMLGRRDDAAPWFERAAARYRESYGDAPPGSWGRPIGALKALLLAGDPVGAEEAAAWALDEGAAEASSPIGRYAGALALLVRGRDDEAALVAATIADRDDFPEDVAGALAALASGDVPAYADAVRSILHSFETRDVYLEDLPVADTVLVLQELARPRGLTAALSSRLLP